MQGWFPLAGLPWTPPGVPEVLRSPANLQDMSSQAHLLPKSLIGNNIAVTLNFI